MKYFPTVPIMTLRMQRTLALLLFLIVSPNGYAQDYKCTINRIASADDSDSGVTAFRNRTYLGKEFTVERRTGLMAGILKNSYVTTPEIVDPGSSDNSFTVVTRMSRKQGLGPGTMVYVLVVKEYLRGSRKPFTFLENDVAFFGTCLHF